MTETMNSVSATDGELARHSADRWPLALKWTDEERAAHLPSEVVRPETVEQVVAAVRQATAAGVPLVPYGAGSGVVGGVVPPAGAISLDLSGMNAIVDIDDDAGTVTAQAGVLAGELERVLNERGRRVPHYPQSLHLASLGGLVATRSAGTFSSKYGNIEDLVVALEVVLVDGTIVRTKRIPRASVGPDLNQLFVGSEGTLGVITEVTLRTIPGAERTAFRAVSFSAVDDGLAAVRAIIDRGVRPAVIRLYDPIEASHVFASADVDGDGASLLVLAFDGPAGIVEAEQATSLEETGRFGGTDLGPAIGETWERNRFNATWFDNGNRPATGLADAIEVSASWPVLRGLRTSVLATLEPHVDEAYAHYSHFYTNGGSIYFIFTTSGSTLEIAKDRYRAAWSAAMDAVLAAGGSISHHHGVGVMRNEWMGREHGPTLGLLARIKGALDPDDVLNPGKLGLGQVVTA